MGYRGSLGRSAEIMAVLAAAGSDWVAAAMGLSGCGDLSCRLRCALGAGECPHRAAMGESLPARLARVAERLGPTFVKAGQSLALRPDIIPARYAQALSRLYEGAAPFAGERARQIVAEELGAPLNQLFADFATEPFAAASLSQVHRATLPDGTVVAVKVQRPGIEGQVREDLRILASLARIAERMRPVRGGLRPGEAVAEVAATLRRELDFQREGRVTDAVRLFHADDPGVLIPTVHWSHTSQRVLTLDFVDGLAPSPPEELRAAGLDPDLLLDIGSRAIFRQVFEHGIFHADPHPGNLRLLPDNRVCFLDFGMFGRVGPREQRRMALVLWALVDGDGDGLAEQLLRLGTRHPGADSEAFRTAVIEGLDQFESDDGNHSMTGLLMDQLAAGGAHGIGFPRGLMLLARALVSLEGTAALMAPGRDVAALSRSIVPELVDRLIPTPTSLKEALSRNRLAYADLLLDLPDLVAELSGQRSVIGPAPAPRRGRMARAVALAAAGALLAGPLARGRRRRLI